MVRVCTFFITRIDAPLPVDFRSNRSEAIHFWSNVAKGQRESYVFTKHRLINSRQFNPRPPLFLA